MGGIFVSVAFDLGLHCLSMSHHMSLKLCPYDTFRASNPTDHNGITTVLSVKSDSYVMFC